MKFTSKIQPQGSQPQPEASPSPQKAFLAQARLNARQSEALLAPPTEPPASTLSVTKTPSQKS